MALVVTCKCGQEFDSPVQMDPASFADPSNIMLGNSYQCPHCGQSNSYDKADHTSR